VFEVKASRYGNAQTTELGAEFHWNAKFDDCSPVNLLNIDWSRKS